MTRQSRNCTANGGTELITQPLDPEMPLSLMWNDATPTYKDRRQRFRLYGQSESLLLRSIGFYYISGQGMDLDETVRKADEHFIKIRSFGGEVVSHVTQVSPLYKERFECPTDDTYGYSVSRWVPNSTNLTGARVSKSAFNKSVIRPLLSYADWCVSQSETHILGDIFARRQFSVHNPSKIIFLHDIDPILIDATPSNTEELLQKLNANIEAIHL